MSDLGPLERQLLDRFQRDFPLDPRPYRVIAQSLGCSESQVLDSLRVLSGRGVVSRVGAAIRTGAVGASTLAAMAVPAEDLARVAEIVSSYDEVNHNYERDHRLNLWFVVTAADRPRVDDVLRDIGRRTGLEPLDLPMLDRYRIDLGFPLQWI